MFLDLFSFIVASILRVVATIIAIPIGIIGKLLDLCFKKVPEEPHTILITGASSGICKEIALQYAKPVKITN